MCQSLATQIRDLVEKLENAGHEIDALDSVDAVELQKAAYQLMHAAENIRGRAGMRLMDLSKIDAVSMETVASEQSN